MGSESRRAARVDCTLPVRLKGAGRPYIAHTVDLSRVGVCLRLHRDELGIADDAEAQDVVRGVNRCLGDVVVAEFHYEVLGALVRKGLRVIRIAVSPGDPEHVELGCDLSTVLSAEEVSFLGVDLPEAVDVDDDVEADADADEPAPLCAYLCPADDETDVIPFVAPVVEYDNAGLVLRVVDARAMAVLPNGNDVGARFEALSDAYGGCPRLLIVHGVKPIWSGRVRVQAIQRSNYQSGFELHLAFEPPLAPATRARLGALAMRAPEVVSEPEDSVPEPLAAVVEIE